MSNRSGTPAADRQIDFATLRDIAAGVPKSFPFDGIVISFRVLGLGPVMGNPVGSPAITVSYSGGGGLGGRSLGVRALRVVEADPGVKQLPALLAACGKIKGTRQLVFGLGSESPANDRLVARFAGPSAQAAAALRVLVGEYRANLTDMVARVGLPHELPPPKVIEAAPAGQPTGPMKTELRRAFAPLGYDCRAESGAYTLRRRTRGNLTVEVYLDVGSWSRSLSGYFAVHGMGFTERLPLPVSPAAWGGGQYPIDGPERWRQIVDNLAVSVAEYDRSFVPAIEAICGPIPDWHRLET